VGKIRKIQRLIERKKNFALIFEQGGGGEGPAGGGEVKVNIARKKKESRKKGAKTTTLHEQNGYCETGAV